MGYVNYRATNLILFFLLFSLHLMLCKRIYLCSPMSVVCTGVLHAHILHLIYYMPPNPATTNNPSVSGFTHHLSESLSCVWGDVQENYQIIDYVCARFH
jgi:hypothetical protein